MDPLIRRRRNSARGGFTLIEMMLALMILGFGLLAVAAMQLQAMEYGRRGRHQTQAASIAQNQLETLQRQPWATIAPTPGWTDPVTVDHTVNDGGDRIELSYQVSWQIADRVAGQTRSIDVRVNWDEVKRPGRVYALSSIRFNR